MTGPKHFNFKKIISLDIRTIRFMPNSNRENITVTIVNLKVNVPQKQPGLMLIK